MRTVRHSVSVSSVTRCGCDGCESEEVQTGQVLTYPALCPGCPSVPQWRLPSLPPSLRPELGRPYAGTLDSQAAAHCPFRAGPSWSQGDAPPSLRIAAAQCLLLSLPDTAFAACPMSIHEASLGILEHPCLSRTCKEHVLFRRLVTK